MLRAAMKEDRRTAREDGRKSMLYVVLGVQ